jgi:hypothetical protein
MNNKALAAGTYTLQILESGGSGAPVLGWSDGQWSMAVEEVLE